MTLSEKNIARLTVLVPSFSVVFLSIILTYAIISYQHSFLEKEFQKEKQDYIKYQKNIIKNEVEKVFDLIDYKNKITQLRLQNQIQNEMESFYSIVNSIYELNESSKSKEWIINNIKETLRSVRFNGQRGYVNIFSLDGIAILMPFQEHYEDLSILNFRDIKNSFYIKESILIAKEVNNGYFTNYEINPTLHNNDKEFYKINYIKLFEPLGIVLSVGEYLDNIENQIKQEILERVNAISFGKKGYIYIVNKDGKLLAHRDKKLIGQNVFKIKDINNKYYFKDGYDEAKKNDSTYLEYISHTNSNSKTLYDSKKLTYSKYNYNYDWVISAGVYIDDIDLVIENKKEKINSKFEDFTFYILSFSIVLIIIVVLISLALSNIIKKMFIKYQQKVTKKENELYKINSSLEEIIQTELIKSRKKDAQLLSQSRFASLGEMIGNIAHQWRQPLSAISTISSGNLVQSQLGILTNEDNIKSYESILSHVTFLSATIDDFRNYLKKSNEAKIEFFINDTINDIVKIIEVAYKDNNIELIKNFTDKELTCFGISSELSQVILNILNNAKDILIEKKIEKKIVKIVTLKIKDKNIIKIYDNGGGVPNDILDKIFDPYFTTKHQSQGTGIGLYMSKDIVHNKFNGTLEVENLDWEYDNQSFEGACFIIELQILQ